MPRLKLFVNHLVVAPLDPPATSCDPHKDHGAGEDCKLAQRGVVLFVGPGKPAYSIAFKPGDVVWYDQGVGHWASVGKNDVVVIDDSEVFALESDLEHENAIKKKARQVLQDAGVTVDGKFEVDPKVSIWHEDDDHKDTDTDTEHADTGPDPLPESSLGLKEATV